MAMLHEQQIGDEHSNQQKRNLRNAQVVANARKHVHQRHMQEGSRTVREGVAQQVGGNEGRADVDEKRRNHRGHWSCSREDCNVPEG